MRVPFGEVLLQPIIVQILAQIPGIKIARFVLFSLAVIMCSVKYLIMLPIDSNNYSVHLCGYLITWKTYSIKGWSNRGKGARLECNFTTQTVLLQHISTQKTRNQPFCDIGCRNSSEIEEKVSISTLLRHEMSQKRRKCHKIIDLYCRKTKNRNNMTFRVKLRHSRWMQLASIEL